MIDPELERLEIEDLNNGQGGYRNGGNNHKGNSIEDPSIGTPVDHGPELQGNPQPQMVHKEYLCERLCKMKPPSFEGSANLLDAKKWLSSMENILDFMELDDRERIICAMFMLKREATIGGSQLR